MNCLQQLGGMMTEDAVRVGAFTVSMDAAERWIGEYFDEAANRDTASRRGREHSPYAYPVYDRYQAGSGPAELTDADLLAPLLLNAAPSLKAVFNLQQVRNRLEEALAAVPTSLSLTDAVAQGVHRDYLGALFGVLDQQKLHGVRLTTLAKILHRKRPALIPLYDSKVKACYCGRAAKYLVRPVGPSAPDAPFYIEIATCIANDLAEHAEQWARLAARAPADVSLLRVFDVVAWQHGKLVTQRVPPSR
ncbi:DUF6308 family protein [Actinacidiphila glaucinigra]|uniref:DUF6308 family protein n=1 Tax=Actinacidiphila glaucinigra TaxID=235986 RepID=UPI00366E1F3C